MRHTDPRHFHAEIERDGLEKVEAQLPQYEPKAQAVGSVVVAQYRRREQEGKQEELRRLAIENLDEQRNGNVTQKQILWTLLATVAVSILIAIFK